MNKIRLMTAITAVFIISLPFAWIFIDAHIIAKITWSLLGILNIIVTYSGSVASSVSGVCPSVKHYFLFLLFYI